MNIASPRFSLTDLRHFSEKVLCCHGVPEARARDTAKLIIETEAFRRSTHGLDQLVYLDRKLGDEIDPDRDAEIVGGRGASLHLDGARVIGPLALRRACELGVEKAREHGTAFISLSRTHWVGALGMYLLPIVEAGFLAQLWAQIENGVQCAPLGGRDGRFGTNPTALAFPGPEGGDPVLADFSTTTMSLADAVALKKDGRTTESARFLDAEGMPSHDPAVLWEKGTIAFSGGDLEGHKAYGLSLFNEALTAMTRETPEPGPTAQNISLQVIDPTAFGPPEVFRERIGKLVEKVMSSRPRPGREVRLPGSRGLAALREAREQGLALNEKKRAKLRELAEKHGIEPMFSAD